MSDDESTQQIDLEALRASLAARQEQSSTPDAPSSDRETSRAIDPALLFGHEDETVMAPPSPQNLRRSARHADSEGTAVTRLDPAVMAKLRATFTDASDVGAPPRHPGEHLADLDDVEEAPSSMELAPNSGATQAWQMPGGDALGEGDTQTALPEDFLATLEEEEALPSFALDEDDPASMRTPIGLQSPVTPVAPFSPRTGGWDTNEHTNVTIAVDPHSAAMPFAVTSMAHAVADEADVIARLEESVAERTLAPTDRHNELREAEATAIFRQPMPPAALPSEPVDVVAPPTIDEPPSTNFRATAVNLEDDAHAAFAEIEQRPVVARPDFSLSGQSEVFEIGAEDLIEDDTGATMLGPRPTSHVAARAPAPVERPKLSKVLPSPTDLDDEEEAELFAQQRFGELIAVYRQRLAAIEGPNRKAAILLKIASVHETGLENPNEAFSVLAEAFEIAPANEDVIVEVDRVGRDTKRIAELAEKVRKRLIPAATDDKRVPYLSSLVFWYERVLGRGNEVSPFVSDIERNDKLHPVILKRAAQIAAMNADVKLQREHLLRALERTVRREEKIILYLALANAFESNTTDAVRWYESVLELDPASTPALTALKRIGKSKEHYGQVQWVLEQQITIAATDAERIEPLLELADLQESKFLKRDEAAHLFERVLQIQPKHPNALKGLERCYHALRDWPKLASILGIRAEATGDKKTKADLLERAAEVHESKLGDPAGAVEVYRSLLVVDPKSRRALNDLARLYERLDDWANVALYKSRIADLATSKRSASQELVKLGDFLNLPDRDPIAAKLQYERAVVVDPTNAGGWEALQKLATEAGDDRRVIECLEQRSTNIDVPRQRAAVLVELAKAHLANDDEAAAQDAFEAASQADPANEPAAVAMLDTYTAEEKWQDAAPLCELLVNAAIRDHDDEALFVRLRLATRIAAALGDADRAVTSSIAALEARPGDTGAEADLIAVCSQSAPAVTRARAQLVRIAESPEQLSTELVLRLAQLLKSIGELEAAGGLFERSHAADPDNREIAKELADLYLAHDDFERATELKLTMTKEASTPDQKFELLVEAGEIWARRAGELDKASKLFEEARLIKPRDPWLLHTLVWLYGELSSWADLASVMKDMADVQETDEAKVKILASLAEIRKDKLDDAEGALELHEQILDLDRKRLDIFQEVVRGHTDDKSWTDLERAYRKMIARVKDDGDTKLQFLLFQQLGLIYRDRLGDAQRAFDALDAASRLMPEDGDVRKIVIELLVVTDNLDNAVIRLREAIDRDPHDPEVHAELYEIFLRQRYFDKAWCAVNVLARMRDLNEDQRRFLDDYAPMPLADVPGQIVEQAWRSHVFHGGLDGALTSLFALMTPAVARLRFGQLRPEQRVGRPFTPNHSQMHDAIRMAFNDASEILAVAPPELLLGDTKLGIPFSPALAPFGALHVCVPKVETQSGSLIFLAGKHLAEQRPELAARAFFPSVNDLASLLATAMRVSRNESAKDPGSAALDASFASVLSLQERDGMRSIVLAATSEGVELDVRRWSHAADLSSMRAGLLIAGDVAPAADAIEAGGGAASDLPARDKIGELYKFATSDLYSDLRGAIGVAVEG